MKYISISTFQFLQLHKMSELNRSSHHFFYIENWGWGDLHILEHAQHRLLCNATKAVILLITLIHEHELICEAYVT